MQSLRAVRDAGGLAAARTAPRLRLSEPWVATTAGEYVELPLSRVEWFVDRVFTGSLDGENVDVGVVRLRL